MTPTAFSWPYWPVFAAVVVWAYLPEFKIVRGAQKAVKAAGSADAGSLHVIVYAGGVAAALGWMPFLHMSGAVRVTAFALGLVVIVLACLLRRHCFRLLGASVACDVRAEPDKRIVTSGAYRLLRHPSYTAGWLLNIGFGLTLGNWVSL